MIMSVFCTKLIEDSTMYCKKHWIKKRKTFPFSLGYKTLWKCAAEHIPSFSRDGSSSPLLPSSAKARQPPCQALSVSWKLLMTEKSIKSSDIKWSASATGKNVMNVMMWSWSQCAWGRNSPEAVQQWSNYLVCQLLGKPPRHPPDAGRSNQIDFCRAWTPSKDLLST